MLTQAEVLIRFIVHPLPNGGEVLCKHSADHNMEITSLHHLKQCRCPLPNWGECSIQSLYTEAVQKASLPAAGQNTCTYTV